MANGQDDLPPMVHVWDIMVPIEKGMANSKVTTGGGQGWQHTMRIQEPLPQRF